MNRSTLKKNKLEKIEQRISYWFKSTRSYIQSKQFNLGI